PPCWMLTHTAPPLAARVRRYGEGLAAGGAADGDCAGGDVRACRHAPQRYRRDEPGESFSAADVERAAVACIRWAPTTWGAISSLARSTAGRCRSAWPSSPPRSPR
ncbi:hypothetical protein HC928_24020, partial [bacterium]|nr:hypothetical protein [bacterium]